MAGGAADQRNARTAGGTGAVCADVAVLATPFVGVSARGRVGASRMMMKRRRSSTIGGRTLLLARRRR